MRVVRFSRFSSKIGAYRSGVLVTRRKREPFGGRFTFPLQNATKKRIQTPPMTPWR
jgi:hypothetical protein